MSATHHDAEIVIKLYELRREEVMRKARRFMSEEFWPQSADEIVQLQTSFGSEHNAYYRQITSFWEMATSLVHRGAVDPELFSDWSGEAFFLYAKFQPYLEEVRKKLDSPQMLGNLEKFVTMTPELREKTQKFVARAKVMSQRFRPQGTSARG
jgi:hypothetical protein